LGTIFLAALVLLSPSVFAADEKAEQDAVKKFKQYVSDLITHYKSQKHERIESDPPVCVFVDRPLQGYARVAYEVGTYEIVDVRKTDSLITPYVGILELAWDSHYSSCQDTEEKAKAESNLQDKYVPFKYHY